MQKFLKYCRQGIPIWKQGFDRAMMFSDEELLEIMVMSEHRVADFRCSKDAFDQFVFEESIKQGRFPL